MIFFLVIITQNDILIVILTISVRIDQAAYSWPKPKTRYCQEARYGILISIFILFRKILSRNKQVSNQETDFYSLK